jgi:hypothetical protein
MKYMKFFFLIFLFTACQKLLYVEVIVENDTGHNIQIKAFYRGAELEEVSIEPHGSYVRPQYIDREGGPDIRLFQDYPVDSVIILFDNQKIIVQSCEQPELVYCYNIERNILNYSINYDHEDLGRKKLRYTYTITEEDYNNAVPIDE